MTHIKRVYSDPSPRDGVRILVDRIWPRGISKERACIDEWRKELAPSTRLRQWFSHDPHKWKEFRRRYRAELRRSCQTEALKALVVLSRKQTITLIYSAADEEHNQAVVLKAVLDSRRKSATSNHNPDNRVAPINPGIVQAT